MTPSFERKQHCTNTHTLSIEKKQHCTNTHTLSIEKKQHCTNTHTLSIEKKQHCTNTHTLSITIIKVLYWLYYTGFMLSSFYLDDLRQSMVQAR